MLSLFNNVLTFNQKQSYNLDVNGNQCRTDRWLSSGFPDFYVLLHRSMLFVFHSNYQGGCKVSGQLPSASFGNAVSKLTLSNPSSSLLLGHLC